MTRAGESGSLLDTLHPCRPSPSHGIGHATTVHHPRFPLRHADFIEVPGAVLDGRRPPLNAVELADVINGYLRQSATMRQAAARLKQLAAA